MAECPICGVDTFEDENSVIGHVVGSTDEGENGHRGIGYQEACELVYSSGDTSAETSTETSAESSAGSGSVLYEKRPEPEPTDQGPEQSSDQCCSSPALTGSAGEMYRLSSGDVVQLAEGDQICTNCDEVIEA